MKLCMHSYTFRAYPLERALRKVAQYGWDGLELHLSHFDVARLREELGAIIEQAARFGVDISVIDFPGNFIQDDHDAAAASLEQVKGMIPVVREFGIQIMNGGVGSLVGEDPRNFGANGSALAGEEHYERAAGALRELGKIAEGEGVVITLEIHMNSLHDTAASTLKLLEMVESPAVMANPDPGNMFATPAAEDPAKAIEMLRGRMGLFHVKNCVKVGDVFSYSTLLELGNIDFYKVFEQLKGAEYDGVVSIEYCGEGDPNVAARRDLEYARTILSELQASDGWRFDR